MTTSSQDIFLCFQAYIHVHLPVIKSFHYRRRPMIMAPVQRQTKRSVNMNSCRPCQLQPAMNNTRGFPHPPTPTPSSQGRIRRPWCLIHPQAACPAIRATPHRAVTLLRGSLGYPPKECIIRILCKWITTCEYFTYTDTCTCKVIEFVLYFDSMLN